MKIEFTKDFAGFKKGQITEKFGQPLAGNLIKRNVAKIHKEKATKTTK